MRNLLLSSCLLCLLSACGISNYHTLHKIDNTTASIQPAFADTNNTYLFKTAIDFITKHYSGLLLVKPIGDQKGHYRVVFSTELGMKFFDLEYRDTSFVVHSCFGPINKPNIINILRDDIGLLLMRDITMQKPEVLQKKNNQSLVFKYKNADANHYYFANSQSTTIEKTEIVTKVFKKGIVTFADYNNNLPYTIKIKHRNFPLKMQFKLLDIKPNKAKKAEEE